ncbi:MAG: phospholipid/cholesterol/gamma-HCH transport system permease protein [Bacteroidales bacterium]|jgi:phospholipid/cholesterol/gamma-HCH transport system permease protein|nr:phospholipid/cholesterol/gamma-HCH transport system permease protein [Bacteroidales bacterium]MDN5328234.1 phospholipid/cholesterol/gamma-HCH transport system permease protein [Bacteroidales bacterium]
MRLIENIGEYAFLMKKVLAKPERHGVLRDRFFDEVMALGFDSMGLVAIVSLFMGAVVAIQTAYNIDSPLIPLTMVGFTSRQSIILELSPTMISLILAGKVGSRIASEIGTMKVTEQVDALEMMGVNSAGFLILPKILAALFFNPILIVMSMTVSLFGGWLVAVLTGLYTAHDYISGLRLDFEGFTVFYALIKTLVFAFIIASVSGYHGYRISGGALDVGKASTRAVVHSSIAIIFFNLIITQMLLT